MRVFSHRVGFADVWQELRDLWMGTSVSHHRRFTIFTQSSPHSSAWDNESGRAPSEPSRALRFPLGLVLAGCQPVSFGLLRPSLMTLFMIERQDPDDVKAFDTRSNIEDRIIRL